MITRSTVIFSVLPPTLDVHGDIVRAFFELRRLRACRRFSCPVFQTPAAPAREISSSSTGRTRSITSTTATSAPSAIETGEFDADRARSDNNEGFGHEIRHRRFAVRPNQLAIRLQPGQAYVPARARRDDDMLGLQLAGFLLPSLLSSILPLPISLPYASNTATLFFLSKWPIPPDNCLATPWPGRRFS